MVLRRTLPFLIKGNIRLLSSYPLTTVRDKFKCCCQNVRMYSASQYKDHEDGDNVTKKVLKKKKKVPTRSAFVDSVYIHLKAGTGGQGLPTKGGVGGRGGDIIAVGTKKIETLYDLVKQNPGRRFTAPSGTDARFFCLFGESAKHTLIPVPLGMSIISETGFKIGEINDQGDKVILAKGGHGGCASNGFSAQKGETHCVTLDLKLIADVGFVGFPNAGKSTLLKALSRATPKIASYPFTTIKPNIGIMEFEDFRRISLADLPGLIEGAHANMGMGHKFLKHVERTKLLLFVVDIHGFQLSTKFPVRSALETIVLLNKELELYQEDLTDKPAILALNKFDLPNSYPIIEEIRNTLTDQSKLDTFVKSLPESFRPNYPMVFDHVVPISAAKDMISVNMLKKIIRRQLDVNQDYNNLIDDRIQHAVK